MKAVCAGRLDLDAAPKHALSKSARGAQALACLDASADFLRPFSCDAASVALDVDSSISIARSVSACMQQGSDVHLSCLEV